MIMLRNVSVGAPRDVRFLGSPGISFGFSTN